MEETLEYIAEVKEPVKKKVSLESIQGEIQNMVTGDEAFTLNAEHRDAVQKTRTARKWFQFGIVTTFLVSWVSLTLSSGLFASEATMASAIIAVALLLRALSPE